MTKIELQARWAFKAEGSYITSFAPSPDKPTLKLTLIDQKNKIKLYIFGILMLLSYLLRLLKAQALYGIEQLILCFLLK